MSEPQPPIPAEDLDRMMNNARDHYPIDDTYTIQGAGKQVEKRACYFQGAKAEHCHLRERIAQLEKELQEMGNSYFKQLEEKNRVIARLKARLRRSTMEDDDVRENEYY